MHIAAVRRFNEDTALRLAGKQLPRTLLATCAGVTAMLLATGCFNPDLGNAGFPCAPPSVDPSAGPSQARCPDGYECVADRCWKGGVPLVDSGSPAEGGAPDGEAAPDADPPPASCEMIGKYVLAQSAHNEGAKSADLVLTEEGPRLVLLSLGPGVQHVSIARPRGESEPEQLTTVSRESSTGLAAAADGRAVHIVFVRSESASEPLPLPKLARCTVDLNSSSAPRCNEALAAQPLEWASHPDIETITEIQALDAVIFGSTLKVAATVSYLVAGTSEQTSRGLVVANVDLASQTMHELELLGEGLLTYPQIDAGHGIIAVAAKDGDTNPWRAFVTSVSTEPPPLYHTEFGPAGPAKGRPAVGVAPGHVMAAGVVIGGSHPRLWTGLTPLEGGTLQFKGQELKTDPDLEVIPSSTAGAFLSPAQQLVAGITHPPGKAGEAAFRMLRVGPPPAPIVAEHYFDTAMGDPLVELRHDGDRVHVLVEAYSEGRQAWHLECLSPPPP